MAHTNEIHVHNKPVSACSMWKQTIFSGNKNHLRSTFVFIISYQIHCPLIDLFKIAHSSSCHATSTLVFDEQDLAASCNWQCVVPTLTQTANIDMHKTKSVQLFGCEEKKELYLKKHGWGLRNDMTSSFSTINRRVVACCYVPKAFFFKQLELVTGTDYSDSSIHQCYSP